MIFVFALLLGWWQASQAATQPRVSATDTAYLSCTTWTGRAWTDFTARSARTPVVESPKGFRAYAQVDIVVEDGSCQNTTSLYVASGPSGTFEVVYAKRPSDSDGNGIRLIGWSPSGEKLLAEVNLWKYETDLGFGHVPLIYNASTRSVKEIRVLDDALSRHFGGNCEFELGVEGWKGNQQIQVKVSRSPETDEYEQHFCVKEPRAFVFDLQKGSVQAGMSECQAPN